MSNTETLPYEIQTLFPWPLYKTNIGRKFTKQEQDDFDTIINKGLDPRVPTKSKRISTDKYVLKRKPLASIQSFIDQHLKQFTIDIMGINDPNVSCDITQSWLNMYEGHENQDTAAPHHHLNSIISGVFYPKCLELPGDETDGIGFCKDLKNSIFQRFLIDGIKPTPFSADYFFQGLDNGDLVLFPSIMNHSVQQNETDQTRISLAFNTFFFGVLGNCEDTSELILSRRK